MDGGTTDYRKYLDPKMLVQLSGLELRARMIVEGFFSGRHRSPYRGLSIEFADHRAYAQGDEIRHIDWKVFGKTDKYYIKEYEQETNLSLMLVVDGSASMRYRSADDLLSKFDYGASLCAALAYLTLQQQDAVGLTLFDDHISKSIRPSNHAHHWRTIIEELAAASARPKTSIGNVLHELTERLSVRTLVVVVSDLFDDCNAVLRGLKHLRYRRHEVIVWNLWDPAELAFPFKGPTLFEGLEDAGNVVVEPRSLGDRYREEVRAFQAKMRAGCAKIQVDYTPFVTTAPLDVALSGYLATRSARLRQRSSRVLGTG